MKNFFYKLLTNHKLHHWSMIIVSTVFILNTIFNGLLFLSKNKLITSINRHINGQVSIKSLTYHFPDSINLHHVTIKQKKQTHPQQQVNIKKIQLQTSLSYWLKNHSWQLSKVSIIKPTSEITTLYALIRDQISNRMRFQPQQHANFALVLKDGQLFCQSNIKKTILINELTLKINHNNILINSSLNQHTAKLTAKAHWDNENYSLDDFILQGDTHFSRFWGTGKNNQLHINGYASLNSDPLENSSFSFLERTKQMITQDPKQTQNNKKEINFEQIDTQLSFHYPTLTIKHIKARVNKTPLSLKGQVMLTETSPFDIQLNIDQQQAQSALSLSGKTINQIVFLDGNFQKNIKETTMSQNPLKEINISVDDFSCDFSAYPKLRMTLAQANTGWKTATQTQKVTLNHAIAFTQLSEKNTKTINIKSQAYNGSLDGKFWLELNSSPPVIAAELHLQQVDTDALAEILPFFASIKGKSDTSLVFSTYPKFNLDGHITAKNAQVSNNQLLTWMANTFDLQELHNVTFSEIKSKFLVNARKSGLYDVQSLSDLININGFYSLKQDGLVSSKLNVSINREILKHSNKCKILHKSLSSNSEFIDFDFQLSGEKNNINFLWLDSATKTAIQENLPNFIERIIEKRVDASLAEAKEQDIPLEPNIKLLK